MESLDSRIDKVNETLKFHCKTVFVNDNISAIRKEFDEKIKIFTKRDEFANKIIKIEEDIKSIQNEISIIQDQIFDINDVKFVETKTEIEK